MVNDNGEVEDREEITQWLNRPCILTRYNHLDRFLLGLVHQPMQTFGDHYSKGVKFRPRTFKIITYSYYFR